VVLLAAAAGALYIYKPALFGVYPEQKPPAAPDLDAPSEETIQPDTPKVDSSAPKDTIADTDTSGTQKADLNQGETQTVITSAAPVVKATNANGRVYPYWVIILEAYKTNKRANKAVTLYKTKGVNAYILDEENYGSLKKIVIGPFSTKEESDAKRKELIGLKKIQKESYSREIKKIP
jgi:cell division septation protein DedD